MVNWVSVGLGSVYHYVPQQSGSELTAWSGLITRGRHGSAVPLAYWKYPDKTMSKVRRKPWRRAESERRKCARWSRTFSGLLVCGRFGFDSYKNGALHLCSSTFYFCLLSIFTVLLCKALDNQTLYCQQYEPYYPHYGRVLTCPPCRPCTSLHTPQRGRSPYAFPGRAKPYSNNYVRVWKDAFIQHFSPRNRCNWELEYVSSH